MMGHSLRFRLVALLVSTVFLTAIFSAVFGVIALQHQLKDQFDEKLTDEIREVMPYAKGLITGLTAGATIEDLQYLPFFIEFKHEGREYAIRVTDQVGQSVYLTQFFSDTLETIFEANNFTEVKLFSGGKARYYTTAVTSKAGEKIGTLSVGRKLTDIAAIVSDDYLIAGIGVVLATIVAILIGFMVSRQILAPVRRITETAEEISLTNLKRRIRYRGSAGGELTQLARTFDRMLARLATSTTRLQQFISDASHELRTPLTALKLLIDIALRGDSKKAYKRALLDSREEIKKLSQLVGHLLLLAQADQSVLFAQRKKLDLTIILKNVLHTLQPLARKHKIHIFTKDISDKSPVIGNAEMLTQAILNLGANAVKFTKTGGTITLAAGHKKKSVWISVTDTGQGITKRDLKRIFNRFYQVDTSRGSEGTGLGLAITEEIIKSHGGKIEVKSRVGRGSEFIITLPRR